MTKCRLQNAIKITGSRDRKWPCRTTQWLTYYDDDIRLHFQALLKRPSHQQQRFDRMDLSYDMRCRTFSNSPWLLLGFGSSKLIHSITECRRVWIGLPIYSGRSVAGIQLQMYQDECQRSSYIKQHWRIYPVATEKQKVQEQLLSKNLAFLPLPFGNRKEQELLIQPTGNKKYKFGDSAKQILVDQKFDWSQSKATKVEAERIGQQQQCQHWRSFKIEYFERLECVT